MGRSDPVDLLVPDTDSSPDLFKIGRSLLTRLGPGERRDPATFRSLLLSNCSFFAFSARNSSALSSRTASIWSDCQMVSFKSGDSNFDLLGSN